MQFFKCYVRHAGEVGQAIFKQDVSGAELLVLRAIHGDGSVVAVRPTCTVARRATAERDRLIGIYGAKAVDALFPGLNFRLPENIDEVKAFGLRVAGPGDPEETALPDPVLPDPGPELDENEDEATPRGDPVRSAPPRAQGAARAA